MTEKHYDAIVIGAGFAGAVAARDLRKAGRSVLVLEARDRIGGRTWTRPFRDTQEQVEMGGAFVVPWAQPALRAEMERYDITTEGYPEAQAYVWDLDGDVSTGFPIPMDEILGFESTLYEMVRNSHRVKPGQPIGEDLADLDVPLTTFLEEAGAGPKTVALIGAFGDLGSGSRAEEISAIPLFCEMAAVGNSPFALFSAASEKVRGGTSALVDAILADADADLRLDTPVRSVEHDETGVTVTTVRGEQHTAPTAIMAVPSNCWADIAFTPALDAPKQLLSTEGHLGRARKVWMLVEGAKDTFALGRHPESLTAMVPCAHLPEGTLYSGFSVDPDVDLTDVAVVQGMIRRYLPEARVLAVDFHDWTADPFSKGAQCAHRAGRAVELIDVVGAGAGRLSFATTDVSTSVWQGWIEGAIESGRVAAVRTEGLLSGTTTTGVSK